MDKERMQESVAAQNEIETAQEFQVLPEVCHWTVERRGGAWAMVGTIVKVFYPEDQHLIGKQIVGSFIRCKNCGEIHEFFDGQLIYCSKCEQCLT